MAPAYGQISIKTENPETIYTLMLTRMPRQLNGNRKRCGSPSSSRIVGLRGGSQSRNRVGMAGAYNGDSPGEMTSGSKEPGDKP